MLKYLYLQNFRNYRYLEFKPDAGFLILTGANGTGKSNLLESIHYLGTGYSFRQGRDNNLMRFGSGYFLIRGIVNRKGIDYKIEVIYREDLGRKTTKINEKKSRTPSDQEAPRERPQEIISLMGVNVSFVSRREPPPEKQRF
jgi:DNA replication and repair protein RecF